MTVKNLDSMSKRAGTFINVTELPKNLKSLAEKMTARRKEGVL